jgi:hypothetical protein
MNLSGGVVILYFGYSGASCPRRGGGNWLRESCIGGSSPLGGIVRGHLPPPPRQYCAGYIASPLGCHSWKLVGGGAVI